MKTLLLANPSVYGPVYQGEGTLIGVPTLFVRLAGCDYSCTWCDTKYAVDARTYKKEWRRVSVDDIVREVRARIFPGCWVTLSGGNPALQDCEPLLKALWPYARVSCETQGSVAAPWFKYLDQLTLSPKPPSSGHETSAEQVLACIAAAEGGDSGVGVAVKVVVFDEADFEYAATLIERVLPQPYPQGMAVLQVGTADAHDPQQVLSKLRWLERAATARKLHALVLPQLHVLAHGDRRDA